MVVGLSIVCMIFLLWLCIFGFFAFTDEDEKEEISEWDKICKTAMTPPTEEQKEKAEKLRKKFHALSFKGNECPYCRCKLVEAGWDEVTGKPVYKCLLCEEVFIYL